MRGPVLTNRGGPVNKVVGFVRGGTCYPGDVGGVWHPVLAPPRRRGTAREGMNNRKAIVGRGKAIQLLSIDDVFKPSRRIEKPSRYPIGALVSCSQNRHQRHYS